MADYRISVDVGIDGQGKLDALEQQIKNMKNSDVKIKANIDFDESALKSKMKSATSKLHLTADIQYTEKDLKKYASQVQRQITAIQSKLSSNGVHTNELKAMESELDRIAKKYKSVKDKLAGNYSSNTAKMINDIEANLNGLYKRFEGRSIDLGIAEAAKQEVSEAEATFKRLNEVNNELYSRRKNLVKMDEGSLSYEQEIKSIRELEAEYTRLEGKLKGFDSSITDGMFNKLSNSTNKLERDLASLEAKNIDLGIAEEVKQEISQAEAQFKKLRSIYNDIYNLENQKLKGNLGTNELAVVEQRIDSLKTSANELQSSLASKMTSTMFDTLADDAQRAGVSTERLNAQLQDLKSASISSLNSQLDSKGFVANFETLNTQINKLKSVPPTLQRSLSELQESYNKMWELSNKGVDVDNFDEANRAIEKFNSNLKETQNLYRATNANRSMSDFTERQERATQALQNQKAVLDKQIVAWLDSNSAAADEFGDRLRNIQLSLKNVNDSGQLNNLKSEFQQIKLEAQAAGKTGLTFGDRLKKQFKEYSSYVGIAGAFAAGAQAMRTMAQNVLEVDTAMTGLYRVTDMTASQYDSFYDDMIASAKEYGSTLTDTINATSDWVRAGFDADTALGLANVTAMYQHVSDLDYDEASQNLLTAYNGFKDSFNEEFGGDAVASVEHIADAFNELDNQYSVTSAGLGEGLARSASALQLAGNTFEEAAA